MFALGLLSDVMLELLDEKGLITRAEVARKIDDVKRAFLAEETDSERQGFRSGGLLGDAPWGRALARPRSHPDDLFHRPAPLDLSGLAGIPRAIQRPHGDQQCYEKEDGERFVVPDLSCADIVEKRDFQALCEAHHFSYFVTGLHFGQLSPCRSASNLRDLMIFTVPALSGNPDYHRALAPVEYCVALQPNEEARWGAFLDAIALLLLETDFHTLLDAKAYPLAQRALLVALCLFHDVDYMLTDEKQAYDKAFLVERRSRLKLLRPATFSMLFQ